ncbi:transketolase [Megasphaera hutchinsoni]|uniref:Transketolase n=1 Tax=Megasphaera hutchinsoni TaxID=1588748 RepID=A0A134CDG0_9FIRM|nr:transketolase [Megasphaera hutchinsoni]KXB90190.1 transketolase [Megasphaera hutchinsoni]
MNTMDTSCVNAIRILSADAIEKANSGHPGLPLGAAPMAYELWAYHMKHNPNDAKWENRDRFVLSGGHGSMLLYSLLHLFGYGVKLDDIKNFRQWGSITPGHPEYGQTIGVDASTGPLGAGMAMAVGMAMAEAHLAALFNEPAYPIVDHYTFVLGGDGCLMEGISSEAFSLAGTLGLHKLIVLYDSNHISIEGDTRLAFTENVQERMKAFGFQTITVEDGTDLQAIGAAIEQAKADTEHPSFITVKTEIGYGCPAKQGKASAHGSPLGVDNVRALKNKVGWPDVDTPFFVPDEVYAYYQSLGARGEMAQAEWESLFSAYSEAYPEKRKLWNAMHHGIDKEQLLKDDLFWQFEDKAQATRSVSEIMINRLQERMPQLMGGSADLAPSNKTYMKEGGDFSRTDYRGRNIHFGVRELAMSGIMNGLALHGGIHPYGGTFFVFSDYMKPMIRLAALMELPNTYVLTHDSIGVGEDGPTHEPVEQLAMYRAMPNMIVFRPADAMETAAAWYTAVTSQHTPVALILSRQNLPQLAGSSKEALRGGYIISEANKTIPDAILIATGSEVALALQAQTVLQKQQIAVRVVSMPSMELFEQQDEAYRKAVLPAFIRARVAIEAGSSFGWQRYVGLDGATVTLDRFGASAPAEVLFKEFGFTVDHIVEKTKQVLRK